MTHDRTLRLLAGTALAAVIAMIPSFAHAAKKGPLEGEPVVRQKLELRKYRVELSPVVGMSLSQPFVHMGYAGARLGFHITDWIGVRAGFLYGVVPVQTKLLKAMNGTLPQGIEPGQSDGMTNCPGDSPVPCRQGSDAKDPAPLLQDFRAGLTRAQWQSSIDVVFTPFSGKLGLFSSIFTEYDLYLFGGLGLVGWNKHYKNAVASSSKFTSPPGDNYCRAGDGGETNRECFLHPVKADTGVKVGGSFGAGVHVAITDWIALNVELQDIVTVNNLTGLNATIDIRPTVNKADRDAFHNVTLQAGATLYFPFKAKRSK